MPWTGGREGTRMAKPYREVAMGVYVLQVPGGQERRAEELAQRLPKDVISSCFIPVREVKKRRGGEWKTEQELLFPGYLFVETNEPELASERLRELPLFMRVLADVGDEFLPLSDNETSWIRSLTTERLHVVEMSEGVIEGDRVIVTQGPLKGREAWIIKVDRHKRLAWLDMRMFGRTKSIKVGLEIVSKRS